MNKSTRRPLPSALARQIKVEAGHRCAIPTCRQWPVEIAHIVPYRLVKTHSFDNLIALCPTCHMRYDNTKDIDQASMEQYKALLREGATTELVELDEQDSTTMEPPGTPLGSPFPLLNAWFDQLPEHQQRTCYIYVAIGCAMVAVVVQACGMLLYGHFEPLLWCITIVAGSALVLFTRHMQA
jgi:hypothetical protein